MTHPTLYLLRHGLATYSKTGYGDTILTASLLPEGKTQAQAAGAQLKSVVTDANFVSPVPRCQETAAIVSQFTGKAFTTDPRISEYHLETSQEFIDRVLSFWTEQLERNYQSILICTHGAVIGSLKNHLTTGTITADDFLDHPDPGKIWKIDHGQLEQW